MKIIILKNDAKKIKANTSLKKSYINTDDNGDKN